MKTQYNILLMLVLVVFITSCNNKPKTIANTLDYNSYFNTEGESEALKKAMNNYEFWKKDLDKNPTQYPFIAKIAASQSQLFSVTGNIDYLIKAEQNLIRVNEITKYNNAGYLRALARNYISQHKFKNALALLKKAEINGENLKGTQKMLFDVNLELGNVAEAKKNLDAIKNLRDFDYLIRLSKWSDHQGNLDAAIKYMEQAKAIAESSKVKGLIQWTYTNIADFYGHAGEIEKSYNHYLKALELNPDDAYAKKGIAWIVYSYENNPEEALRILNEISKTHSSPDYHLLKAEIAQHIGDNKAKEAYTNAYMALTKNENYGDMYNAYNVELLAEDLSTIDKAFLLAKKEVDNRPTAQSYDLLAWTYYKKGDVKKALEIMQNHVVGHTFEPAVMCHLAEIYKANGQVSKAEEIKKDLLKSTFELGPVKTKEVLSI